MVAALPGLKAGAHCNVEVEDREFGEIQSYPSRVEDLEEDRLFVDWPSKKGQLLELPTGEHVQVSVPTQSGATLFMDTEIVRRVPPAGGNPIPMLVLRVLAVGRQQQRGHFRLGIAIQPIDCAVWERDMGAAANDGVWRPVVATITDLSGGGVGLNSQGEIPEEALLRLRFPYPMGEGDFTGDVRVKSVIPLTGSEHRRYKIGTAFEDHVDRARRERLARCIHRVQLEQKRRAQAQGAR